MRDLCDALLASDWDWGELDSMREAGTPERGGAAGGASEAALGRGRSRYEGILIDVGCGQGGML